jgi:heptosyltransferase I
VDKYEEVARKFRNKGPDELRWGQRIEYPGVMDLIEVANVVAKLDDFMRS